MYEQIINGAIPFGTAELNDACILLMEGFLAFYLVAEMLPSDDAGDHSNDDYYLLECMARNKFTMKQLQKIAKDHEIPDWSSLSEKDLARKLYNAALL